MNIFDELGLNRYLNAQDTLTKYGASCMPESALRAMEQIAGSCVDMFQVQEKIGDAIARMTRNEAAYIANGAAGALLECAAAALALDNEEAFHRLPEAGPRREILMQKAQENMYDRSLRCAGAQVTYVGSAEKAPTEVELESAISEKTAAICHVVFFGREHSLPLETVIAIAHRHQLPVIVDAAAQLPPASNLWYFTQQGADMVIFSGGKTLRGPQDSGLVVGKKEWIERLRRFGPPTDGVCRGCKTSREAMAGLYAALREFLSVSEEERQTQLHRFCDQMEKAMESCGFKQIWRTAEGPVGQQFPLSYGKMPFGSGRRLCQLMREKGVYAGPFEGDDLMLNPLMLLPEQVDQVCSVLQACMEEYRQEYEKGEHAHGSNGTAP